MIGSGNYSFVSVLDGQKLPSIHDKTAKYLGNFMCIKSIWGIWGI